MTKIEAEKLAKLEQHMKFPFRINVNGLPAHGNIQFLIERTEKPERPFKITAFRHGLKVSVDQMESFTETWRWLLHQHFKNELGFYVTDESQLFNAIERGESEFTLVQPIV